jgi:acetolactate synthase-1/2/3 large subunit
VLVDVPMDIFSADLEVDAFATAPPEIAKSGLDPATAARIVDALATSRRPVLYAGGGVLSGARDQGTQELAEALQVPVAHTLMGKGCLPHEHPLLLGQSGFWGTPIANEKCRTADLIVAIGTRLAEANSSSWDPRFTFSIPPTRLIHIDADLASSDAITRPSWACARMRSWRWRRSPMKRAASVTPIAAASPRRSRAAEGIRVELGRPVELVAVSAAT